MLEFGGYNPIAFTLTNSGTIGGAGTVGVFGTLELGSSNVTITNLSSGGLIDGTGTLTVTGAAAASDTETGSGTTVLEGTTTESEALTLDGGRVLENKGTVNLNGGYIELGYNPYATSTGSATIKNDAGATFDIQDGQISENDNGTNAFVNAGLFEKTVTGDTTDIQIAFTNTGSVSVQTGSLWFGDGGTSDAGGFTVASGAVLNFVGGTFTMTGGTFNVAGITEVSRGVADFSAATITSFGSMLSVAGGTLALGSNNVTVASLYGWDNGGDIDGTGTLTVTGGATLTSSSDMETGSGTTILEGTTTDSGWVELDGGRVLENKATFNWTGSYISMGNATIKNDAGATFDIQTSAWITGTNEFANAGLLEKTVAAGTTRVEVALINAGTVSIQIGTLELDGGGTSNAGGFTIATAAGLDFGGGTFAMSGGVYNVGGYTQIAGGKADFSAATITSFGSALDVTGGTLELGSNNVTLASLSQSGGDIDGTGTVTVTGATAFSSGYDCESGPGTTLLKGGVVANYAPYITSIGSTDIALDGGRLLENMGKFYWLAGEILVGDNPLGATVGGGEFENAAGAALITDAENVSVQGYAGTTTFLNAGTWSISGTANASSVSTTTFANTGTVTLGSEASLSVASATALNGSGTISIGNAASLDIEGVSAAGQHINFTLGAFGTLDLGDPSAFTSTIGGFVAGDFIDLEKVSPTKMTAALVGSNLAISINGTQTYSFALASPPPGETFQVISDGNGGADIAVAPAPALVAWARATSADWSTAAAWTGGAVPGTTASVTIKTTGGAYTVTIGNTENYTVGKLVLNTSNAELAVAGSLAVTKELDLIAGKLEFGSTSQTIAATSFWQAGGTLDGTGTVTFTGTVLFTCSYQTGTGTTKVTGTTNIANPVPVDFGAVELGAGRVLENAGTINWTVGNIYLNDDPYGTAPGSCAIKNDAGATFDIQSDQTVYNNPGTNAFLNAGLLEKTVTSGTTDIQVAVTNTGTVSVQTGTLEFDGGGASRVGGLTIAAGAVLDFGGSDTFSLTSGGTIGGGTLSLSGGTLELGSNDISVADLFQTASDIDGTGTLTVTGTLTAAAPPIIGYEEAETGSGTTMLKGTTTDDGDLTLDGGRVLENEGTFKCTDGYIDLGYNPFGTTLGGATIKNDAGATFAIEGSQSVNGDNGTTGFSNAGLLEKIVSTGTAGIDHFTNTGTVSVQTGTLELDGGTSALSGLTIAAGATLDFGGSSTFTLTSGGTINGTGTLGVSGGTLALGSNSVTVNGFSQTNASEIVGTGTLTVTGTAALGFGSYAADEEVGSGATILKGTTTASGSLSLDHGRVLENKGTFNWTGGYIHLGYNPTATTVGNATIKNDSGATFDIQFDQGYFYNEVGTNAFINAGLLEKTVTSGATYIQVAFTNTGTVSVQTGTLELDAKSTMAGVINGSGSVVIDSASTFANLLIGGTVRVTNNSTIGETGPVTIGDGTNASATLVNASGAAYNIDNDSGIAEGTSTGSAFTNIGTLAKTAGTGTSVVAVNVADTGTITIASGILDFTGASNSLAGSISGTGTIGFGGGNSTLTSSSNISGIAGIMIAGNGTLTLGTSFSYAGTWTESAGTVALGVNTLTLTGTSSIAGTVMGTGTLAIGGGTDTLKTGANLSVSKLTVSGKSTTLTVGTNLSYGGTLVASGGTVSVANGNTLTLTGTNTLTTTIGGAGTLSIAGGTTTLNVGSHLTTLSALSLSGGTLRVNTTQTISGSFLGNGGTVSIVTGDTFTLTGTNMLATTVSGGGTLAVAGGITTLNQGSHMTGLSNLKLTGGTLAVDTPQTFAGKFVGNGGTLSIASGDTFTLTGTDTIASTIGGAGTLSIAGGAATLKLGTHLTDLAALKLSNAGTLTVATPLTFAGALTEAVGTTMALDASKFTLTGASSTLNGALTGTGTLALSSGVSLHLGGTVSSTESVALAGTDRLLFDSPTGFGATISGLDSTDGLDFTGFAPGSTSVGFVENSGYTAGVLTVKNGSTTITLTLKGNYASGTFTPNTDGHSGTLITYATSGGGNAFRQTTVPFVGVKAPVFTSSNPNLDIGGQQAVGLGQSGANLGISLTSMFGGSLQASLGAPAAHPERFGHDPIDQVLAVVGYVIGHGRSSLGFPTIVAHHSGGWS